MMNQGFSPKLSWLLFACLLVNQVTPDVLLSPPFRCYHYNRTRIGYTNILKHDIPKNEAMFYVETSCVSKNFQEITLERRQACGLESAALSNPNRKIYVLFMSNVGKPISSTTDSAKFIVNLTQEYPNIFFYNVNFTEYILETPVEKVGKLLFEYKSPDSYRHAADLLKLVTLWRYGGICVDFDMMVLNSLSKIPKNFLGAETDSRIGSAVMGFSQDEFGHEYITTILEDYARKFHLKSSANMGSNLMSRMAKMLCQQNSTTQMMKEGCEAIKIYAPSYFYPIPWNNWTDLFDARQTERIWKRLEGSYMVHFWNKRSFHKKLRVNSFAPYVDLARTFCPKMLGLMDNYL